MSKTKYGILDSCIISQNYAFYLRYRLLSKKNFAVVYAEDTGVADFATLAGGEQLDVAPTAIERVTERNDVMQFEDRTVGFPDGNIDRVAGI